MKYPIGIQSFDRIREDGYVYVDKTALIYELVSKGTIYFLSRPRRFGKSLLVSTLENYFLGHRELFRGLAIDSLEKEWKEYPVFHIDFNGKNFTSPMELKETIETFVAKCEEKYGKDELANTYGDRLAYVFEKAHEKTGRRVVVLIDEYDKPLLDVMNTDTPSPVVAGDIKTLEDYNREILKGFYSIFKLTDKHLQFVLLTGVTKFSQVSVFSGFNQPADISYDSRFDTLCGISEKELLSVFKDQIQELGKVNGMTEEETIEKLKQKYDGYHFSDGMIDVFNPFSLLNCFQKRKFMDYWFSTGTPTYLMRLLANNHENISNPQYIYVVLVQILQNFLHLFLFQRHVREEVTDFLILQHILFLFRHIQELFYLLRKFCLCVFIHFRGSILSLPLFIAIFRIFYNYSKA